MLQKTRQTKQEVLFFCSSCHFVLSCIHNRMLMCDVFHTVGAIPITQMTCKGWCRHHIPIFRVVPILDLCFFGTTLCLEWCMCFHSQSNLGQQERKHTHKRSRKMSCVLILLSHSWKTLRIYLSMSIAGSGKPCCELRTLLWSLLPCPVLCCPACFLPFFVRAWRDQTLHFLMLIRPGAPTPLKKFRQQIGRISNQIFRALSSQCCKIPSTNSIELHQDTGFLPTQGLTFLRIGCFSSDIQNSCLLPLFRPENVAHYSQFFNDPRCPPLP